MYFNQEYVVARRVLELANTLINTRNRNIRHLHITTDQADALIYYHDFPNQTISDLKNFQHIRHQSAQAITQKLVDKGLVRLIEKPEDHRSKQVELTDAGNMMRLHLKNNGSRTGEQILDGFSDNEKQQFLALLEKSISNLNRGNK